MAGVRDEPASHSGDLGKTPVAHLLVYALDRKLTGELVLLESGGAETVVRFERGTPVKIRVSDGYARLGEMLITAGAIDEKMLAGALATSGMLGDVLLLVGCVSRGVLEATCELQFRLRMRRLFALPVTTSLRYVDGGTELSAWGGDPACVDPLEVLWGGVREHGSTALVEALASLGDAPIALSAAAPLDRFGFTDDERLLLDHLAVTPSTLAEIAEFDLVPRETLDRLVYLTIIARLAELGSGSPIDSAPASAATSSAVARMQLRPLQHRLGAAAPDPPGAGEHAPISSRGRRGGESKPATESVEESPASAPSASAATPPAEVDARSSSPSDPSPIARLFKG